VGRLIVWSYRGPGCGSAFGLKRVTPTVAGTQLIKKRQLQCRLRVILLTCIKVYFLRRNIIRGVEYNKKGCINLLNLTSISLKRLFGNPGRRASSSQLAKNGESIAIYLSASSPQGWGFSFLELFSAQERKAGDGDGS